MTPEQIIVSALNDCDPQGDGWVEEEAAHVLDALREAGWTLHRLDDYEHGIPDGVTFADNREGKDGLILLVDSRPWTPSTMSGTYALVPIESDSPEGER